MAASVEFSVYKSPYNNCCQMSFSLLEYTKICPLVLTSRPHWESFPTLQRSPETATSWFQWAASRMVIEGGEGRTIAEGRKDRGTCV